MVTQLSPGQGGAGAQSAPAAEPVVYVNGKRWKLPDGYAETTLLEYLREIGLKGTKLGCGEGGCGACTVMVSHYDAQEKKVIHRSVNACLAPLYSVEGMHVVTVEGIGNRRDGLHPVQERLASSHGSQCGFCTPGFVMSMYSLLRSSDGPPTQEEIEENLAGNLCRCTGYRPIVDAFRVFAKSDDSSYSAESADGAVPPQSQGGKICPSTGQPCGCSEGASKGAQNGTAVLAPNGLEKGGDIDTVSAAGDYCGKNGAGSTCSKSNGIAPPPKPWETRGEPIFPQELKTRVPPSLCLSGSRGSSWYRPTSLEELLQLKAKHPDSKLVIGNTEVGIEMRFKKLAYPVLIGTTHITELSQVKVSDAGLEFGASVTLAKLQAVCKQMIKERPAAQTSACKAIMEQLRWFAGNQIRNVSSIGGNVVTGSPISDLNPLWIAAGAVFSAAAAGASPRKVAARDFFLGYRKVDLQPSEILASVFLPWTKAYEYVKEFKQAHRRDDDIAIVNAGMRVSFEHNSDTWIVNSASLAFGGVAPRTVSAPLTEEALIGKPWGDKTLQSALNSLADEIQIIDNAPGGMVEFRRSLITSFFFKFFVHVAGVLEGEAEGYQNLLNQQDRSAGKEYERPPSKGVQFYDVNGPEENTGVGAPQMHMSAQVQVTGEAEYTDDILLPSNGLNGALVLSSKPHAKIVSVDTSEAEKCVGFVGYFDHKSIPGTNNIGAVRHDEEVFASEKVTCVGQVIGVVVADTEANARLAVSKVRVEYEELPPVLSILDALETNSFIEGTERVLGHGDVDACFSSGACDHIISGEARMGGQEHFYLEPNSSLILPGEAGGDILCIASTQAPTHHQKDLAAVLGLPAHRVVCKAKRIGGGFGGKETRAAFISCAAAVPAFLLKRPVRVTLDRDVDMATTGQRHAFVARYKVGFTKEGKILALDAELFNNGGNSMDLSHSVLERALFHSDNVYQIPNMRVRGKVCFTNQPTNTAFRGFGGPQGMMVVEMWLDHVARTLKRRPEEIKEMNFQKEGDVTHYGQVLERFNCQRIWSQLKASCQFETAVKQAEEFNAQNRWRKRGVAIVPTKFGISFTTKFLNQAGALVHVYTDGTVLVTHGGIEMGQGLHTKVAQVAATTLGVPLSSVYIAETSTDKVPNTSPTAASASSDLYGAAVLDACQQIMKRLEPMRAKMPEGYTFTQLVNACYLDRIDLSAHGFYITPDISIDWATGKGRPFNYYTEGSAFCEVEIDCLTGDFQVLRSEILMDVGRSLNPAIDIGQIEGAFVQGMGWCVIEEVKWGDKAHTWVRPGHLFTQGPGTYKLPTVNDIPVDFKVGLLKDAPNPRAVHSSKAIGEPPLFLASSVLFAIKDAIASARKDAGHPDFFVLDSPATPERIRMACCDQFTAAHASPDLRPKLST